MNDKDALYWKMRLENDEFLRRQQWWTKHYLNGTFKSQRQLELQRLALEAEALTATRLQAMDYQVHPTTHKCPFDLWVQDHLGRAVRVEVKISLYYRYAKGGRYQCNVRHHDQADLLIFIARNDRDWPFIIPMTALGRRCNVAIWSYCPGDYTGQWSPYLEAWPYLSQALQTARPRARQLSFPLSLKGEGRGEGVS